MSARSASHPGSDSATMPCMFRRSLSCLGMLSLVAACPSILAQTALEPQVKEIIAQHHGHLALYATNLKSADVLAINADTAVPTASVIKLTILIEAIEQIRTGKATFEEKLTLRKEDQVA